MVLDHFSNEWKGIHCETSFYLMLFSIFFFDILFCSSIPFVFQHPYQEAPLDLRTEWFYLNRKTKIKDKLKILKNYNGEEIREYTKRFFQEHEGIFFFSQIVREVKVM